MSPSAISTPWRPRWLVPLASLLVFAVAGSACVWQWQRGRAKDALAEQRTRGLNQGVVDLAGPRDPTLDLTHRRVRVEGRWVAHTVILQDNQTRDRVPGYLVYTALRRADGSHVLVRRGWIAGGADRSRPPVPRTPAEPLVVEGISRPPASRFLELQAASLQGTVWQNVTLERYAQRFGLDFEPLVLEQHSDAEDGLVRDWPEPASGSAKHYGYAFQWAAIALTVPTLHLIFFLRRRAAHRQT